MMTSRTGSAGARDVPLLLLLAELMKDMRMDGRPNGWQF